MALRIDSYWQRTRAQMWAAFYPSSPLPLAIAEGLAILAKYGIEAHLFIPGVGKVNGIDAQNFLESTFVTPAVVNGPVGGVKGSADNVAVTNIRINITSTFGSNYVGIGELRVKDGTGVMINLANATLTASSQYGTWSPDRMKDGGTVHDTQSWRSDGTALPQWVNISFPSPVKAAVVEIQNTNPAGLSESARIGDIEVTNSDSTVSYYPYTRTSDAADAISRHTIGKLHLTQATTANKPMLGVEPMGGRRNVLIQSETFNASPWDGTATHTYESAPTTAPVKLTKITATSATTSTQSVTAAATSCVVSWIVRGVSSANTLVLRNVTTATNLTGCIISPDYTQSTGADITVEQLGDNVRKISITYATGITVGDSLAVYLGSDSGVGDWTEFGGVQLSWGTTIYPYQRTLSAYEAYEDGKDSIYYWQKGASASWLRGAPLFDGTVRDYLSIASARPAQSDNTWSAILDPCSTATGVQTGTLRGHLALAGGKFVTVDGDGNDHTIRIEATIDDRGGEIHTYSVRRLGNTVSAYRDAMLVGSGTRSDILAITPTAGTLMSTPYSQTSYDLKGKGYCFIAVQATAPDADRIALETMADYISGRVR